MSKIKSTFYLPFFVDRNYLGTPLKTVLDFKNIISQIIVSIGNKKVNFIDLIKGKAKILGSKHYLNITSFDSYFKFFILKDYRSYFVMGLNTVNNTNVVYIRFSLNGIIISFISDSLLYNGIIAIKYDNNELHIKDNNVLFSKQ